MSIDLTFKSTFPQVVLKDVKNCTMICTQEILCSKTFHSTNSSKKAAFHVSSNKLQGLFQDSFWSLCPEDPQLQGERLWKRLEAAECLLADMVVGLHMTMKPNYAK